MMAFDFWSGVGRGGCPSIVAFQSFILYSLTRYSRKVLRVKYRGSASFQHYLEDFEQIFTPPDRRPKPDSGPDLHHDLSEIARLGTTLPQKKGIYQIDEDTRKQRIKILRVMALRGNMGMVDSMSSSQKFTRVKISVPTQVDELERDECMPKGSLYAKE